MFIYPLTALLTIFLRKSEFLVTLLQLCIVAYLYKNHDKMINHRIIKSSIILTLTSYVCVKYLDMFRFNYTKLTLPLWFFLSWMIVGYFMGIPLKETCHIRPIPQ